MMYIAPDGLAVPSQVTNRQALYERLTASAAKNDKADANADFLAQMISSWCTGMGALPRFMGLEESAFQSMVAHYFPHADTAAFEINSNIEPDRAPEADDVMKLLLDHRAGRGDLDLWFARIVAIGCMGSDHLWSDLGLFSRPMLGAMLKHNFPQLAALNDNNMRWKKFFYRQLCAIDGFILCRSPSCEICSEYAECFAPATE